MAVDILSLGFKVDTKDLSRGSRELDNFGKSATKASGQADIATKSMASMSAVITRFAAILGSAGLAKTLINVSDQYTKLNAQLSISARTQADYSKSLQDVIRISNLAQTSIDGTATLYARLANTLKGTNVTQQQFANITESVALGLRVSGATTAEAQSAMLQLSQAFAAGVLRGEEFNAVSEASFPLMKALADSMGIPIEKLRSLAMDGKITRDELVKAFGDPALIESFKNQAKELNTVGGAFQVLKNNLSIVIGEINETTGASNALAEALTYLASSAAIKVPFEALAVLGVNVAYVFNQIANEISGIGSQLMALAKLDFKKFGNIRETMIKDAKQARIEIDAISDAILNPKPRQRSKSLNSEALSLNTNLANATNETKKLTDAQKEYQRILDNRKSADIEIADLQKITGLVREGLDIEEAQFRVASERKGLLPAQVEALLDQKNIQDDIAEAEKARQDRLQVFIRTQQKAYDDELKRIEEVAKMQQQKANENFKEAQDAQKQIQAENQRMADNMNRSLTDALLRGFESGLSFAENFKRTLRNMFATLVLQPIINFALQPITSAVSSVVSGITGGAGATGGITDIASTLGGIGNLFTSTNASILSGIQGVGTAISTGMGGIRDSIGGFIGANSAFIAKAVPFLDAGVKLLSGDVKGAAFSGAGAGIGLAIGGPLGAAVGSFVGNFVGGLFGGKKQPPRTVNELPDVAEVFNQSLSALIRSAGGVGDVTSRASFTGRAGGSGYGDLNAMVDGVAVTDAIRYQDAYGEKSMQEFITRTLTTTLTKAIQSVNIDQAFKDLFTGVTDREEINKNIQAVVTLNQNNKQLTDTLGITATQVALLARESEITGDNLISLVNMLTGVSSELFTTGDALVAIKAGIDGAFTTLANTQVPANLKAFDEAMKAIDKTTAEGRQDFLGLLALRETFAEFENTIGNIKGSVRASLLSIASDTERQAMLNEDLTKLFADLNLQVPATVEELFELGDSIDYTSAEGINLATVFDTLVTAFVMTKGVAGDLTDGLRGLSEIAKAEADLVRSVFPLLDVTEQLTILNADLFKAFDALGIQAPRSSDELIELSRNIDFTTEAGLSLAKAFPNLVSSFLAFENATKSQTQALKDAAQAQTQALKDAAQAQMQIIADSAVELNRIAQENLQEANRNVDIARDNLMNSFDAERSRLQGIIDNVATLKDNLSTLISAEKDRQQAIIDNVDNFKNALRQAFDTRASGLQETIDKFKNFGNSIRDFRKGLLQSSAVIGNSLNFNRARFLETATLAKAGDITAMDELTSVATNFLQSSQNYSKDFNEYQSDFLEVNRILAETENSAFATASVSELQLDALKQQVSNLISIDKTILSVDDAITQLNKAQAEANIAQLEIERLNVLQTMFLGSSTDTLMSLDESLIQLVLAESLAIDAQTELNNLNNLQVSLLGEINQSVLSVTAAIAGLNFARQEQAAAQSAASSAQAQLAQVQPKPDLTLTPESIYRKFLGREPDAEGLAYWKREFGASVDTDELRTFQQAVIANQALGFDLTDEARSFASLKFANGAAFTNGIVSRPTMFNTGMMGEAGSEAIMPLSNINGKLGVSTNNSEMVAQLKVISEKMTRLEAAQIATVQNTGKVAKIIERADNGDSINVTVVTE